MRAWCATAAAILALAPALAGCTDIKCGKGTFKSGNQCLPYDPKDKTPPVTTISPPGGRSRAPLPTLVTLTTDKPATIYYTTDGSTPTAALDGHRDQALIANIANKEQIQFFAVDLAGNTEAVQTATYDSDTTPPAQVTNLTVTVTGTTAHVSWTPPTDPDYTGTVLARVAELVDAAPPVGQVYPPGTLPALSTNLQIVSTGMATTFDDPGRAPGPVRYVAWTYDDLGNYSAPVAASTDVPIGALTAQLTYNTTNNTFAIVSAPANFDLSASTANLSATTPPVLTINLAVKNNTKKYLQNPKAEVVSVTNAAFGNSDGTADGNPFRTLGPNMLAPAATVTRALTFNTITAGSTVTVNLALASHPSLITTYGGRSFGGQGGAGMFDLGAAAVLPQLALTTPGPNQRTGGKARTAVLVGGHYLDVASSHGVVERFDLATRMLVMSAVIGGQDKANVQSLISTGAELIALVKFGGNRNGGMTQIMRLDERLHVVAHATLPFSDDRGFSNPALSPDGKTLAIPLSAGIALIDTRTLVPQDADPTTPGIDLFDPSIRGRLGSIVFIDATHLLVLAKSSGAAAVVTLGEGSYTTNLIYNDNGSRQTGFAAAPAPDGTIWMAFATSIKSYDPATATIATVAYTGGNGSTQGVVNVAGKMWVIRGDHMTLDQVSTAGVIQQTLAVPPLTVGTPPNTYVCSPQCNGIFGHWIALAP